MKTYTFQCCANAGKCDDTVWDMEFSITDEQEELLIEAIKSGACCMSDDERLSELHDDLINRIVENEVDNIEIDLDDMIDFLEFDTAPYEDENGDIDEDAVSEEILTDENKREYLWNIYSYSVGFPRELLNTYQ